MPSSSGQFKDNFPCYQFSFSNNGLITAINDYFLKDLGYEVSEIKYKMRIEDLLTAGGRIYLQTHFYPLIKMQRAANEVYLSFVTSDQRQHPVLFNMALAGNNDTYTVYCAGMQISKRNLHEKELLKAKKLAEKAIEENHELIAVREELKSTQQKLELQFRKLSQKNSQQVELNKVLSHDLKEPLRKIKLFASVLSDQESALSMKGARIIEKINSFAVKVSFLLENLEQYNSLDNKKLQYVPIRLSEVFKMTAYRFENIFPQVKIIMKDLTALKNDFSFQCDRSLLINLISEIINYSITNKNIEELDLFEVTFTADVIRTNLFIETKNKYQFEDCMRFVISDNGSFFVQSSNPFHLFDRSHSNGDILNISLAYSQKIVQLLNGQITLTSDQENGTVFTIVIPINI